jgi:hypothetical protein
LIAGASFSGSPNHPIGGRSKLCLTISRLGASVTGETPMARARSLRRRVDAQDLLIDALAAPSQLLSPFCDLAPSEGVPDICLRKRLCAPEHPVVLEQLAKTGAKQGTKRATSPGCSDFVPVSCIDRRKMAPQAGFEPATLRLTEPCHRVGRCGSALFC